MKKQLIATGVLTVALMGVGVGAAQAHTPTASINCTQASVSLTNYDKHATAKITLDNIIEINGQFNGSYVHTFPLTGNIEHTLTIDVISQDGAQYNYHYNNTTHGCYVLPVVPTKPPVIVTHGGAENAPDCVGGTVTITHNTTTTDWALVNNVWVQQPPVTVQDANTTRPVTAQECPPVPTPTPTVTPPVTHTQPPTTPVSSKETLAYTGIDPVGPLLLFAALVIMGVGFKIISRARKA